jgi:hypothetical protein
MSSRIAVVHCPHAIGWCYVEKPMKDETEWLMRLPCPCNEKSTVLAEFDALDLIRMLSPDGSVERDMQQEFKDIYQL